MNTAAATPAATPAVAPAARVLGVEPYRPPAPSAGIDLKLDANEGPSGALPGLSLDPRALRRYPDASTLERAIAERWKVEPARVVVTAGADDAIDRLCRATLEPGRTLLTHAPSFEMITRSARLAGAEVDAVDWLRGEFPEAELIERISPETALIALVTPNNPTGREIPPDAIHRIAGAAQSRGAMLLLDAAYGEFATRDVAAELLDHPAAVIVRTFSKAFGLASLRVGYAIAPNEATATWLRAAGGPYPTSGVALAAATAALEPSALESVNVRARLVRDERAALSALIRDLGGEPLESGANFVTAFWSDAPLVRDSLAALGISVKSFGAGPLAGALRITLPGDENDFARLRHALRSAVAPEAVLFDMDGVLADVSESYRAAILETARSFGADVTRQDVARLKNKGDANNDWILTRRLIAAALGSAPSLAEVTERFQTIYLGRDDQPGLRDRERLLIPAETLRELAARKPLAVVTGRPRAEALWFLDRFNLASDVAAVIAQEDAPAKPSPAGVRLAMSRLGVDSAWMLGDTVDDARAARAARVVPLGVAEDEKSRAAQRAAGCARVAPSARDLLETLP